MVDTLGALSVCGEDILQTYECSSDTALKCAWVTHADASQSYFPQGHTQWQLREASMQPWAICQRTTGGGMRMIPSKDQTGWVTRCVECSVGNLLCLSLSAPLLMYSLICMVTASSRFFLHLCGRLSACPDRPWMNECNKNICKGCVVKSVCL